MRFTDYPFEYKIVRTLEQLSALMRTRRNAPLKWAMCHGVFDRLHIGHIVHLQWARDQADRLIVSVTPDSGVSKGPGRPREHQGDRLKVLAALQFVDYVILNEAILAVELLSELTPDIYVKGPDIQREPTPDFFEEREFVLGYGGRVLFSPPWIELHTTEILDHGA